MKEKNVYNLILLNINFPVHCEPSEPQEYKHNAPGTAGGPGGRDQTLAVKSRKTAEKKNLFFLKKLNLPPKNIFFWHISSSYATILGESNFQSKAKDGKEREKKID